MSPAANPLAEYEAFLARTRPMARVRPAEATWFKVRNAAEAAEVYIFDDIGEWGVSAQALVDQLRSIAAPRIDLHINSRGGSCFDGFAIYTCLKAHPAFIHVYVDGLAASAASFIAQAGSKITIGRNAMMMVHQASGVCLGTSAEMRQMGDLLDQLDNNIADIYSQRAGGDVTGWLQVMAAETWYTGAEAVAAGLADEMTDPDQAPADAPAEMANSWDLSVFRYAGRENAPAPSGRAAAGPAPEVRGQAPADTAPPVSADPAVEPPPAPVIVGEHGPELVNLPQGATVLPAAGERGPELIATHPDGRPATAADPVTPASADTGQDQAEPDDWAATVAALTQPDPWADATRHLTSADGWAASVAHLEGATL